MDHILLRRAATAAVPGAALCGAATAQATLPVVQDVGGVEVPSWLAAAGDPKP